MTAIDRAEQKAMKILNYWVDALLPKFNAIEMHSLKVRLTTAFREYETQFEWLTKEREQMLKVQNQMRQSLCSEWVGNKHELDQARQAISYIQNVLTRWAENATTMSGPLADEGARFREASQEIERILAAGKNS